MVAVDFLLNADVEDFRTECVQKAGFDTGWGLLTHLPIRN